jgi:phage gp36-like protein
MAAYHLVAGKGFQPDADPERPDPIRLGYEDAIRWLTKLAAGTVSLAPAETSPASSSSPDAASDEPRGF